jgi:hypothetical protein
MNDWDLGDRALGRSGLLFLASRMRYGVRHHVSDSDARLGGVWR